jgi:hypothetical protein
MAFYRLLLVLALIAGGSSVARADLQPPDPFIGIDDPQTGTPITVGTMFTPINGGGIFDFYNPETSTLTELEFLVDVEEVFYPAPPTPLPMGFGTGSYGPFSCASPGIFATCLIQYETPPVSTTYTVIIDFFDPNNIPTPADPGIPPGGDFAVDLNNNNAPNPPMGGWTDVTSPFDTTYIATAVPEPSMTLLLAAGCALLFALRRDRHGASRS